MSAQIDRLKDAAVTLEGYNYPDSAMNVRQAAIELEALRERCDQQAEVVRVAKFIADNRRNFCEYDPDGIKAAILDELATALGQMEKEG